MKDPDGKLVKAWKIGAGIVFGVLILTSGYLTLKNDFIPNFNSWLNPFHVEKRPVAAEIPEPIPVLPTPETLLAAVNEVRAKAGVAPLTIDSRLNSSAQVKADDMKARNYFAHIDPSGKHGYMIAVGYAPNCAKVGEDLQDSGTPSENTVEKDIAAWVGSPTHYEQLVMPEYNVTGFGITSTGLVEHFCQL